MGVQGDARGREHRETEGGVESPRGATRPTSGAVSASRTSLQAGARPSSHNLSELRNIAKVKWNFFEKKC